MQAEGWYPDPAGSVQQRYWDGSSWSDQTRAYAAPEVDTDASSVQNSQLIQVKNSSESTKNSGTTKWVMGFGAAVIGVCGVVGFSIMNRHNIDEKARESAEMGANTGGTANSLLNMYNILCPDGPSTIAPEGVNCLNPPLGY